MFFVVSKVLGFFAEPTNLLIVLGLMGALLLATRFARLGVRLMLIALVLLAVFGLSPAGNVLILPLEERFPRWDAGRGAPDGIVVLGGAMDEFVSAARGELALNEAGERMTETVALARRYPGARIVFAGGESMLLSGGAAEAEFGGRLLVAMGIDAARITLEAKSRNSVENARFSKALADPKPGERWLLVTSAYHMPRAVGTFRRVGFSVEPYPVDWRTGGTADVIRPSLRAAEGLRRCDLAVREWVGLVMYWLAGYTSELFPGPAA
jgi:uncharacterized SAM-binding protein YcdF (DUF218 family)